jgi:hypothetical protein
VSPIFSGKRPSLNPEERREVEALYLYHAVREKQIVGTTDPGKIKDNAIKAAAKEMRGSHTPFSVPKDGPNPTYLLPNSKIVFGNRPAEEVAGEIGLVATRILKDRGPNSGMIVSNPIIDGHNTSFAVSDASGIIGFVEWDGTKGEAREVTPATDKDRFAALQSTMIRSESDIRPNQHLAGDVPEDLDELIEMAKQNFRNKNDGRMPVTDEEKEAVFLDAQSIADDLGLAIVP